MLGRQLHSHLRLCFVSILSLLRVFTVRTRFRLWDLYSLKILITLTIPDVSRPFRVMLGFKD